MRNGNGFRKFKPVLVNIHTLNNFIRQNLVKFTVSNHIGVISRHLGLYVFESPHSPGLRIFKSFDNDILFIHKGVEGLPFRFNISLSE
jgi:hypothetical protein